MKTVFSFACFFLMIFGSQLRASNDSVTINPGLVQQVYYNMNSGILSSVSNTDWDLGFQMRGQTGSVIINSKRGVKLWRTNKAVTDWSSMTLSDTTGFLNNAAFELFNSDKSWSKGAFNQTNNPSNIFDLGWGVYDFATHIITGDSVYFIKLGNNDYRKLKINSLDGFTFEYSFTWANLDGTNELSSTVNGAGFPNKHFGYYSLLNNVSIDREPVYNAWDLTFCQYLTLTPFVYPVGGVLSNQGVSVQEVYPVSNVATATPSPILPYSTDMDAIGYDWKSYNNTTGVWTIQDSTVYFVQDLQGDIWKMVMMGYGGVANGNFYFDKSPAVPAGLSDNLQMQSFAVYPNPATDFVRMVLNSESSGQAAIRVIDFNGRCVASRNLELTRGLQTIEIDLPSVPPSVYQLVLQKDEAILTQKVMIR